jgi:hypothetical protein
MKKLLPICIVLIASPLQASEVDNWYVGALYNSQEISIHDRDFNAAGIIAGYQYNQYFAVETRFNKGTSGYSTSYNTIDSRKNGYKEDIDSQASISLKASYPIFESFSIYGLAGYTETKLKIQGVGQNYDSSGSFIGNYTYKHTQKENGLSYGIGLNYQVNKQLHFFVDHQVLPDFEPSSNYSKNWKSTSVGFNYYF